MKKAISICLAFLLFVFSISTSMGLIIKLGSLAPSGTLWAQTLSRLQAEWSRISGGSVILKIYGGGSVGDEGDMLRKIKIGQLNAAALTGPGLTQIVPSIFSIYVPRLVQSEDEFTYLIEKMKPVFDAEFESQGYKAFFWVQTGWVYLFSRYSIVTPEQLKQHKVWIGEGDDSTFEAWQKLGCNPVPLKITDIVMKLQTGGIDTIISSPFYVLSYDLYKITRYMNELKLAPFTGAIVIDLRTWNKIDTDLQEELEEAANEIALSMQYEWSLKEQEAIETMQKYGLIIHDISSDVEDAWKEFIDLGFLYVLGEAYERSFYDMASSYLEEYRNNH
jgi:TRAP-type C4-dicarboxylate transport system substrate-binding protein